MRPARCTSAGAKPPVRNVGCRLTGPLRRPLARADPASGWLSSGPRKSGALSLSSRAAILARGPLWACLARRGPPHNRRPLQRLVRGRLAGLLSIADRACHNRQPGATESRAGQVVQDYSMNPTIVTATPIDIQTGYGCCLDIPEACNSDWVFLFRTLKGGAWPEY